MRLLPSPRLLTRTRTRVAWAALLLLPHLNVAQGQASGTCLLPSSPPPDRSRVIFILDTSGSMQGFGDGQANIFGKVQASILRGMRATQAPGSVELLTFDKGPRLRRSFAWPAQQGQFETTVQGLKADGSNTWLYASMESMFSSLQSLDNTATTVYVITDGINNDPDRNRTIRSALDAFNVSRGPFDKLYYIALAAQVPPDVQAAFKDTNYARFLRLPLNQAPDFTQSSIAPGLVNVRSDGTFAFKRPPGTTLELDSDEIGGAQVSITPLEGDRVKLNIQGNVPAGAVGYMCAFLPDGMQALLLRFQNETPPRKQVRPTPQQKLGTLKLLNPDEHPVLKKGQSATWRFRAVGGPVNVEVLDAPPGIEAKLPDQSVSLSENGEVALTVVNRALKEGERAAPRLKVNDYQAVSVPPVQGRVPRPFPWAWLLVPLLPIPLILWWRSQRRPVDPYALSIDRTLRVSLHDRSGFTATRVMRQEAMDMGKLFRVHRLEGLRLERFKPEIPEGEEVLLDNSNMDSIRRYTAQQMKRDVKLQAQPALLRLHKEGEAAGTFLAVQETLKIGQKYIFTDIDPPPVRVRPAPPPPEPPIEVIVTLLRDRTQEHELPLEDVDLANIFQDEELRGLIVRREPGALRLRGLRPDMQLRHISRTFAPGDALPLAVMLNLSTAGGECQIRVKDKASLQRYQR